MEWVPVFDYGIVWWELRSSSRTLAWARDRWWWLGDVRQPSPAHESASLDDAKDAAWTAVYRSTR